MWVVVSSIMERGSNVLQHGAFKSSVLAPPCPLAACPDLQQQQVLVQPRQCAEERAPGPMMMPAARYTQPRDSPKRRSAMAKPPDITAYAHTTRREASTIYGGRTDTCFGL